MCVCARAHATQHEKKSEDKMDSAADSTLKLRTHLPVPVNFTCNILAVLCFMLQFRKVLQQ